MSDPVASSRLHHFYDGPIGTLLAVIGNAKQCSRWGELTFPPETIVRRACCAITLSFGSVVFSPFSPLSYFLSRSIYVSTSAIARHRHRPAIAPPAIALDILNFSSIREHSLGSCFSFHPSSFKPTRRVTTYVILEHGADPNISNSRGKTPFDVASRLEILQLPSDYRAKPISL